MNRKPAQSKPKPISPRSGSDRRREASRRAPGRGERRRARGGRRSNGGLKRSRDWRYSGGLVSAISVSSPAKLNLMLAITGRRADGFHELVSVVAPVTWGDRLHADAADDFSLACDDPGLPLDGGNLVLKAAEAFRAATGWRGGAKFRLEKRIPVGAGLGGGSSNAVAALRALNALAGQPLAADGLETMANGLGSDCALFLRDGPVVMRGRGDRVEPLPAAAAVPLRGRKVLIFKPDFSISTAWAYGRLAAGAPRSYLSVEAAEARLAGWLGAERRGAAAACSKPFVHPAVAGETSAVEPLLFNSMEPPAFEKFPALPALLDQLRTRFGLSGRMSGSGSACFAFLPAGVSPDEVIAVIRAAWGASAFAVQTQLA